MRQELHAGWSVVAAGGEGAGRLGAVPLPATVPGCVHLDLLAAGLIPDPYLDENEAALGWVGRTDWTYRTTFARPPREGGVRRVDLVAEGLDTVARVELNGVAVGMTRNMHRTFRFDVTSLLRPGENHLTVVFRAPLDAAEEASAALGPRPHVNAHRTTRCGRTRAATAGTGAPISPRAASGGRSGWSRGRPPGSPPSVRWSTSGPTAGGCWTCTRTPRRSAGPTCGCASGSPAGRRPCPSRRTARARPPPWPGSRCRTPTSGGRPATAGRRCTTSRSSSSTAPGCSTRARPGRLPEGRARVGARRARHLVRPAGQRHPRARPRGQLDPGRRLPAAGRPRPLRAAAGARPRRGGQPRAGLGRRDLRDRGLLRRVRRARAAGLAGLPLRVRRVRRGGAAGREVVAEAAEAVTRLSAHPSLVLWCGGNECLWGHEDWGWQEPLAAQLGLRATTPTSCRPWSPARPDPPVRPRQPVSPVPDAHPNDPAHGPMHIWDVWNERDYTAYLDYTAPVRRRVRVPGAAHLVDPHPGRPRRAARRRTHRACSPTRRPTTATASSPAAWPAHLPEPTSFEDWHWATQLNQARAVARDRALPRLRADLHRRVVWQLNDCWPVIVVGGGRRRRPAQARLVRPPPRLPRPAWPWSGGAARASSWPCSPTAPSRGTAPSGWSG